MKRSNLLEVDKMLLITRQTATGRQFRTADISARKPEVLSLMRKPQ
jgi:hypothetical protein